MRADTHDGPEQMLHVGGLRHYCSSHVRRSWNSVLQRTAGPYILHDCGIALCRLEFRLRRLSGRAPETLGGPGLTDAVEKGFLGGSPSNIDSRRASNAQDRFKNSAPMIRLLRAGDMPGTFSTVSTQLGHQRINFVVMH